MLSERVLNRTLLQRQHLLEPTDTTPLAMVEHLLGLQAQEVLPPYLSLRARLREFDPVELSDALEERAAVRLFSLRGTIHLLTAADALALRGFVQGFLTATIRRTEWGRAFPVERYAELADATYAALADGPLPGRALGEALVELHPALSASAATNLAKTLVALVQLPPRGLWQRSAGQVYDTLESWLGGGPPVSPDPSDVVRRYLSAYGPATPADLTAWSGASGSRAAFNALGDELVRLQGPDGKQLWDLAGLEVATGDEIVPVRLLGKYDNLWLSHAGRDRVTRPHARKRWMGLSGGMAATVFVDGWLEGMWRRSPAGLVEVELFRELSAAERTGLDAEVAAVEAFLS